MRSVGVSLIVEKSLESRPIPVMLSKRYKQLLREELRARAKEDPDFEAGRWKHLDKLLQDG